MSKNNKSIIILGSSRSDGNTKKTIELLNQKLDIPVVDLNALNILPFDYEHNNKDDDYIPLMEKVMKYEDIILATPVYWYTMSSQMKVFLDRLSDLLKIRKDLGRKLAGKNLYLIASFATSMPEGFELAFSQTCDYMDMNYRGCFYHYVGSDPELLKLNATTDEFTKRLQG